MYPSMIPFFRDYFEFGLTLSGILLSALWAAYAMGQIPGGVIGDRFGEGNVLVLSTGLSAIAIFLVSIAFNVGMLFIGTVAFGFATGLYGPTRFTIFTDLYSKRAGTAIGLTYAAGNLGNTVLPPIAAGLATYTSWRLGYGWLVPLFLLTALAIWKLVPSRTSSSSHAVDDISIDTLKQIANGITMSGIPIVVAIHILLSIVSQGFLGFYPTYLVEIKGFSAQTAAIVFGSYFVLGAVAQPVIGMALDRFGSRRTLFVICVAYGLGLFSLYYATTFVDVLILTVLLCNRSGAGVITNTYISDTLPETIRGSGLGILRTVWILIGASSPILVGFLGDGGMLDIAFIGLAAVVAIAAILTLFIGEK